MTGATDAPLGWTISRHSQAQLDGLLSISDPRPPSGSTVLPKPAMLFSRLVEELSKGDRQDQCSGAL